MGVFCACLLDYQLGGRNGIELLQQASIAQCRTPVIFVTGTNSEEIDLEAINAGAVDYLIKGDLNVRTLERALRYAIKMGDTLNALREAATHDEVTELLNRRALDKLLEEELVRAARFKRSFALTLIDLDFFKQVNDNHGHRVGDQVLRHVSNLLAGQVRSVDRVARYGGEEFAIVQIETECDGAIHSTRRLQALLAEMPFLAAPNGTPIAVTLSAGIASFPRHGQTVAEVVNAADRALYEAKSRGRNCIVTADDLKSPATGTP